MDFSLNEEQKTFQSSARQFIESKGELNLTRRYTEGEENILEELWAELGELGYLGINISEQYGGLGMGALTLVPVLEEIGRAVLPGPYAETMALATPLLEAYGTKEQKQKYLSEIASGKRKFSLALLEESIDFHPSAIQLEAKEEGNDYIITGKKLLVPHANVTDTLIVPVRTGRGHGEYGISLLLVDREDTEWQLEKLQNIDETRNLFNVTFNQMSISREQLLGEKDNGWAILQEGFVHLNAALCSTMVGGIEKVVEMATEYANTRTQFGQPIGRFQAIKHRIVDMRLALESSRSLSYFAGWAIETGSKEMVEAVALAKSFSTESYIQASSDNIQIHGGMGFTWEFDCHFFLKRAKALENYLGSPEDYRNVVAQELGW